VAALTKTMTRLVACALLLAAAFAAAAHDLLPALREDVLMLPGPGGAGLETTLFRPPGDGPFPLVVVNHGKARGDPRRQPRARYLSIAHELVQRGYAVALPMRRGFSRSGGIYEPHACDSQANGREQADDIGAAIDALARRADLDASRVVVIGQSAGGLATLALGTRPGERVAGVVNFAGGLRDDACPEWQQELAGAFAAYGRDARVPGVWFYGAGDPLFALPLAREWHRRYTEAGADAMLVSYDDDDEPHALVERVAGRRVWLPEMARFFTRLGLPFDKRHVIAWAAHDVAPPPARLIAALADPVPHLRGAGVDAYADFLAADRPRAFALGADGSWAWYAGSADAMTRALAACRAQAGHDCVLYAVDDVVVWTPE
jgi:dienelactone hydrolase